MEACAFCNLARRYLWEFFTAAMVSRLQFLGVRVAGVSIALFGGLMTAFNMAACALILWVMPTQVLLRTQQSCERCTTSHSLLVGWDFPFRLVSLWRASAFRRDSSNCFRNGSSYLVSYSRS